MVFNNKIHKVHKNHRVDNSKLMTDLELISMFAREAKIPFETSKENIGILIECIRKCLDINGYVNLRRLGRIHIMQRKKMRMKNFEGVFIDIPMIYIVKFDASASLRSFVNVKLAKDRDEKLKGK